MNRLNWIVSGGGPLILISEPCYELWSGILKRSSYLDNKIEEADNLLEADKTDYGKACSIQDYLGVVSVGNDTALVLGDEALLTTILHPAKGKILIARLYYVEDEEFVENRLNTIDLNSIDNWEYALSHTLTSDKQYLIDSACSGSILDIANNDYISVNIMQGNYEIWTSIYEPDDKTKLIIHRFDITN